MKTDFKYSLLILCIMFMANVLCDYTEPVALDTDKKIISRDVKCLVCKATVDEMERAIKKVDPKKKVEVGGFRMNLEGDTVSKTVPLARSETYLTELMEKICDTMDDYAKARYKTSRKLTVLKLMTESGGMNPEMSAVDFVQDGDLNKSLKHYCLEILEDNEESVLEMFMKEITPKNIDIKLCTDVAHYCDDEDTEDDYKHEEILDHEEL